MKKLLIILTAFVLVSSLASAVISDLGPIKQDSCTTLFQTCDNCTYNNITSIIQPNSTALTLNAAMTKSGNRYTYEMCDLNLSGNYIINGVGDEDGKYGGWNYKLLVTYSGKAEPSSVTVFLYYLIFTVFFLVAIWSFMNVLAHFAKLDADIVDVFMSVGAYFAIFIFFIIEKAYFADPFITSNMEWVLYMGAITNLFMPILAFVISMIVISMKLKREERGY